MAVGTATALIGGSVLSAGAGAIASKKAAKAQRRGQNALIAAQERSLDKILGLTANQRAIGDESLNELRNVLLGGDLESFQASPDFQFRRDEGLKGIAQSLGAGGQGAFSGNALRALNDFNSNLASGEFGNFVNRRLALAGLGQNANFQAGNAALSVGNNVGNALAQQGNARASGILGGASAINQGLNGVLQSLLLKNQGLIS